MVNMSWGRRNNSFKREFFLFDQPHRSNLASLPTTSLPKKMARVKRYFWTNQPNKFIYLFLYLFWLCCMWQLHKDIDEALISKPLSSPLDIVMHAEIGPTPCSDMFIPVSLLNNGGLFRLDRPNYCYYFYYKHIYPSALYYIDLQIGQMICSIVILKNDQFPCNLTTWSLSCWFKTPWLYVNMEVKTLAWQTSTMQVPFKVHMFTKCYCLWREKQ